MIQLQHNRRLSEFSTFGIGGPVRFVVEVSSVEHLQQALFFAHQEGLPFLVIGKGSNSLFQDRGFQGLLIVNQIDFCEFQNKSVVVGAGYSFSRLGVQTARKGFSGLEFASGIPASVGGAIFMNAGANGQETQDALLSVLFLDERGEEHSFLKADLQFAYRHSSFQQYKGAIASAVFALEENRFARSLQLQILNYRIKTQPYKDQSIGCIFRNPLKDVSAGALIDRCGLKGMRMGGAKISEMHANFIVNDAAASSCDVLALIAFIQGRVLKETGIQLQPEIRVLP